MILSTDELKWIDERMKIYDIRYREIYNEIFDHIITAIEEKRKAGDTQEIKFLFQEVVDRHFGGYNGIEKLVASQEDIYKQTVQHLWKQSIKYYLKWPMLVFTAVAVVLSLQLPDVKMVRGIMMLMCMLLAFSPMVYGHIELPAQLKRVKGKRSILKEHFVSKAATPAMFLNLVIYLPNFMALLSSKSDNWNTVNHLAPPVFMAIVMAFIVLNLGTIRFCRQMLASKLT